MVGWFKKKPLEELGVKEERNGKSDVCLPYLEATSVSPSTSEGSSVVVGNGEGSPILASTIPLSSPSPILPEKKLDLNSALEALSGGGGRGATEVIGDLGKKDVNLPMKSSLKNPLAFTAVQVHADFSESLGMFRKAALRRKVCEWQYQHGVALNGERARAMFESLNIEVEKEYEINKRAAMKGAMG